MNRSVILSSLSLSFALGACGGVSEGGSAINDNDQEALRRVDTDLPVPRAPAPTHRPAALR